MIYCVSIIIDGLLIVVVAPSAPWVDLVAMPRISRRSLEGSAPGLLLLLLLLWLPLLYWATMVEK